MKSTTAGATIGARLAYKVLTGEQKPESVPPVLLNHASRGFRSISHRLETRRESKQVAR